jgi:hypothetical protein
LTQCIDSAAVGRNRIRSVKAFASLGEIASSEAASAFAQETRSPSTPTAVEPQ